MLLTNTIQRKKALEMVEYKTIILIASFFAIDKSLINIETALYLAKLLEPVINTVNDSFLITKFFITIITNSIAAILTLSIIYEILFLRIYDIRLFLLITAIGACVVFLSLYSYQINPLNYNEIINKI